MPKKDYGPATRKSQRRTTASEEPILRAEDREETLAGTKAEGPEPEEPARLALGEKREPDRPLPSIEENEESEEYDSALENNSSELEEKQAAYFLPPNPKLTTVKTPSTMPEGSNNGHPPGEMEQLLQRIARLEAEANNSAYNEREHSTRGITPINSAFGGADFRPVGFAAHPAFRPFGADQHAKNADFDRKARESRRDPGTFEGDKDLFDKWIIKLADKCEEDMETFKTERSRMALVFSLTDGPANDLLEARYSSSEIPFKNAAEMVATLSAVYHDENQGTKAREELRKLKYDPADKDMDIHRFIGKVNSLADKAGIAKAERKIVLYEHIPADLDLRLLRDSKDVTMSYENFAGAVADAALAKQRAYQERLEKKQARRSRSPTHRVERKTSRSSFRREVRREARSEDKPKPDNQPRSTEQPETQSRVKSTCFLCQKEGHLARHCPQRKVIAAVLAAAEQESERFW